MTALVAVIHVFLAVWNGKGVDARAKPAQDASDMDASPFTFAVDHPPVSAFAPAS